MNTDKIDFNKLDGLVPCIIQDYETDSIQMCGFMNSEAFEQTKKSGQVTFYSRTKERLWTKGETSGNFLNVISISTDCDQDTILIRAAATGPVCHLGTNSCFGNEISQNELKVLERVIRTRKSDPDPNSYTSKLFDSGINKIAQKVGEEAVELIIEAKDDDPERFLNEAADLMYHYLVLLQAKGFSLKDVEAILKSRRK
jgi:phosphoribosyl-ATP pyrophosphohydrolase/phosphoribosyl-AMP cyclohydrolase